MVPFLHLKGFFPTRTVLRGILDYGLMTRITPEKRVALIEYLIHVPGSGASDFLSPKSRTTKPKGFGVTNPKAWTLKFWRLAF